MRSQCTTGVRESRGARPQPAHARKPEKQEPGADSKSATAGPIFLERNTGFEPATFALAIRYQPIHVPPQRFLLLPTRRIHSGRDRRAILEFSIAHRRNTNLGVQLGSKVPCSPSLMSRGSSACVPRPCTRSARAASYFTFVSSMRYVSRRPMSRRSSPLIVDRDARKMYPGLLERAARLPRRDLTCPATDVNTQAGRPHAVGRP
jgi:hypothetical protein